MSHLRNKPMVTVCAACAIGICVDRYVGLNVGEIAWWLLASISLLGWYLSTFARKRFAAWLLLAAIGFGMATWHHIYWRLLPTDHIALAPLKHEQAEPVALRCRVTSVPESSPLPPSSSLATIPLGVRTQFRATATHIRHGDQWLTASGKISVRANGHLLGLRVGDLIQVFGSLSPIPAPLNPGQHDLRKAARTERLFCRLDVPYPDCIRGVSPSELKQSNQDPARRSYNAFLTNVGEMRVSGLSLLDEFVGSPQNVLAGALLLGARDRLGPERTEYFFHTGTIHLLAISGLHLGILTWFLFVLAKKSSLRRWAVILLMIFSMTYCFLTGMREPILRAAILVHVVCVGMIWRRQIVAYNALAAAAVMVLSLRPAALFRPGAQLSFLAVGTLIWLSRNYERTEPSAVDKLIRRTQTWYGTLLSSIRETTWQLLVAGLAVWFVTMPLVMLQFHLLSPIALVLNVLLMLPIVVSLLSGFIVLLLGNFLKPIASMSGFVCDQGLAFVESIVQSAHDVPAAFFWVAGPQPVWCGVFYVGISLLACVPRWRPTKLGAVAWLCIWLALPSGMSLANQLVERNLFPSPNKELRCTFLSIGHGTCVVLELPDDRVLLYDCGRMGVPQSGVRIVSDYLWHRRVSHLDGVILSHADADHYNIFPGLLDRFSVGEVLAAPVMFQSDSPGVAVLHSAIKKSGTPIREIQADDLLTFGEVELEVLHPLANGVRGSDNANSVVLEVRYLDKTILLPGDLESPGLEDVIAENVRDVDVLMAPHHGSMNSSPIDFTRWCTPEFVVISGGHDEELQAKQRALFSELGPTLYHTASDGAITVTIAENQLVLSAYCE